MPSLKVRVAAARRTRYDCPFGECLRRRRRRWVAAVATTIVIGTKVRPARLGWKTGTERCAASPSTREKTSPRNSGLQRGTRSVEGITVASARR